MKDKRVKYDEVQRPLREKGSRKKLRWKPITSPFYTFDGITPASMSVNRGMAQTPSTHLLPVTPPDR
jgi:hypothetical protein